MCIKPAVLITQSEAQSNTSGSGSKDSDIEWQAAFAECGPAYAARQKAGSGAERREVRRTAQAGIEGVAGLPRLAGTSRFLVTGLVVFQLTRKDQVVFLCLLVSFE